LLAVRGAVAELERELILSRTRQGLAAAWAKGKVGGRKPKMNPQQIAEVRNFYEAGESMSDIASIFNVSRATLYRALEKEQGGEKYWNQ
jgi:DNA invertase Pin-like site-specific DNA recombinase